MLREERVRNCLHLVFSDCRLALRILCKSPAFATIAILTLAVGISACTVIFSIVYGVLVRPLPYPNLDRVVRVYMHFHPQDMEHGTMSDADFRELEDQNRCFEALGLFQEGAPFEISGKSGPELVAGAFVTASFFSTLGQQPLLGRSLLPADEKMGSPNVVVLSERLWRRLFNADPDAIGQSLRMSGQTYMVVGVMPKSFSLPSGQDELWTNYQVGSASKRGPWFSYAIGRLKPGVKLEEAQAEVNEIGHRIERANPALYANLTLPLVSMRESIIGDVRPALLLIFGAVGFVLLIAIVNVSNLLLVRATSRLSEIAIRRSLGAATARIASQLATESLLLAFAAGILGVFLSYWGVKASQIWHPSNLPRVADLRLDGTCLAFICFLTLGTGMLCSLFPAILTLKTDLSTTLKTGKSASSETRSRHRAHSFLVVTEIALSVALLVGAGLLLRSFMQLRSVDAGFYAPLDNILTLKLRITQDRPINSAARIAIFERLFEKARTLPEVRIAAISRTVPPYGGPVGWSPFMVEGQTWDLGAHPSFPYLSISQDYFRALAIPLLRGRYFTENDKADSTQVAIISDSFTRRYFRGEDPLGKRIKLGGPEYPNFPYRTIVGVVGDVRYFGLASEAAPTVYVPLAQEPPVFAFLVVRFNVSAVSLVQEVQRSIQSMGGDVVLVHTDTMGELLADSVAEQRFQTTLLGVFAGIALVLAAVGVYGVVAYTVVQRTHEIGIRLALGAQRRDISRFVMAHGIRLTTAGLTTGIAISLSLSPVLRGLLFHVKPGDPVTLACVAVLLGLTALAACYVPAHRAIGVDPIVVLRYE